MSSPNLQQKKVPTRSLVPEEDENEQTEFYSAGHKITKQVYKDGKIPYRNTPEEDAEEMFFDKIMTLDNEYIVDRQINVMTRFRALDGQEYIEVSEKLFGRTQLGNAQTYIKQHNISEHDEPEIHQTLLPGSGERMRKKGESVVSHNLKHDIPWNPQNIAECMRRVKEPLRLQLYVEDEGERPFRIRDRNIWMTYSWDEITKYCQTGQTKGSAEEKFIEGLAKLTPEGMRKVMAILVTKSGLDMSTLVEQPAEPATDPTPLLEKAIEKQEAEVLAESSENEPDPLPEGEGEDEEDSTVTENKPRRRAKAS